MAIQQEQQQQQSHCSLLDALYCEEEQWDDDEEEERETETHFFNIKNGENPSLFPLFLLEHDLFWEDEELLSLFSKETEIKMILDSDLSMARREAVDWMMRVNSHYGFSALTAILAINYLDRFISSFDFQREKPWMIQLAAVTCLSLAAKVEETQVPLLLDFQVEGTKYVFEAKTIQRMELLVLSTLQWRMNPITPLSFLDHIIRRLGLKTHLHWEFFRQCESLLLSVVSDSRFVGYVPSVLATATMLHVIQQLEPCNPVDYQNQLLGVLKLSWEKVNDCYQLVVEISKSNTSYNFQPNSPHKRKCEQIPSTPSGVINTFFSTDSNSNSSSSSNIECLSIGPSVYSSYSSSYSSSSSSPEEPPFKKKKSRASEQRLRVPSLSRVFVDAVASPH